MFYWKNASIIMYISKQYFLFSKVTIKYENNVTHEYCFWLFHVYMAQFYKRSQLKEHVKSHVLLADKSAPYLLAEL